MKLNLTDYDYQLIIGQIAPLDPAEHLSKRIKNSRRRVKIDITDDILTSYGFMVRVTDDMWVKLVNAFEQRLAESGKYVQINGELYDKRKIECLFASR